MNRFLSYGALHFAVFNWGASGIMAQLLSLPSAGLVVYRSFIALAILLIFNQVIKSNSALSTRDRLYMLFTGLILGIHWWCFFSAIQYSTVSIGLICISSAPIFIAFIQPLVSRTSLKGSQLILGIVSVLALIIIYKFETNYTLGILLGIAAGFLDAVYTVLASKTNRNISSTSATQYHMAGSGLIIFVFYSFSEPNWQWLALQNMTDIWGVLFLGVICSAMALSLYIYAIKHLSAFTAALSLNLEAVYGIILALIIFGEREYMSAGLYFGASILIGCVVIDGLLSRKTVSNISASKSI